MRCLARRGMLHSECEAADYVRLNPDTRYELTGRDGAESVWIALRGEGAMVGGAEVLGSDGPGGEGVARGAVPDGGAVLSEGAVLLAPDDGPIAVRAGASGLELLCVRVLPEAAARRLPARRPEV